VTPIRAVLLDFYGTLVDLSDPVRSRGFDDFVRQLSLPLGPGELYRISLGRAAARPDSRRPDSDHLAPEMAPKASSKNSISLSELVGPYWI
jgi:FMN phosphatase YigB (HAD superfamily)